MDESTYCLHSVSIEDYAKSSRNSRAFDDTLSHSHGELGPMRDGTTVYDFLALISTISHVYSCGQYMPMLALNDMQWLKIAGGRHFLVSCSSLKLTKTSALDGSKDKIVRSRVVVKKVAQFRNRTAMRPEDIDLFVRELAILHHLRGHENIVQLHGVGWAYDCLNDADLTPCPKPAILVEQAAETLESLINLMPELSFLANMRICRDVANGLFAIHQCGLLHGDVKPANILIFPETEYKQGEESVYYKCKISDFSLARTVEDHDYYYTWGTPPFTAPEYKKVIPSQDLLSTDVWSLGVLFAIVVQRHQNIVKTNVTAEGLGNMILEAVRQSIQSSTWDAAQTQVINAIFNHTIRHTPENRKLDQVVIKLEDFLRSQLPSINNTSTGLLIDTNPITTNRNNQNPSRERAFTLPTNNEIYISYETFKHASGQVHDTIVSSLKSVASNPKDSRQRQALFELAVFAFSGYADPACDPDEGLVCLRESATLGDVRAQGLFYRICNVYNQVVDASSEILDWLQSAASQGHSIAIQDLMRISPSRALEARKTQAQKLYSRVLPCKSKSGKGKISANSEYMEQADMVHLIIATGLVGQLEQVWPELSLDINLKDMHGDTPLIIASKFVNFDMLMKLLELGADPIQTNHLDENFMHFVANFTQLEIEQIISRLSANHRRKLFTQNAQGIMSDNFLDYHYYEPGTPLERAVVMKNPKAVQIMLHEIKSVTIVNGQLIRRTLLLALRLHLNQIQEMIVQFVYCNKEYWDHSLPPLYSTSWEYKDQKRSFLDAVLVGGVSGFGLDADIPLKWWHLCQNGKLYSTSVDKSIRFVFCLTGDAAVNENHIDAAVPLVLRERFSHSLSSLLEWKAKITDGQKERVRSITALAWNDIEPPITAIVKFYRVFLQNWLSYIPYIGRFSVTSNARQYYRYYSSVFDTLERVMAINSKNTAAQDWVFHRFWQGLQTVNCEGYVEKPVEIINYVDQIYYHGDRGTLLHQSMYNGDRGTFHLLLQHFGANAALPAPGRPLGSLAISQINCYSLLAGAGHNDLWFSRQLRILGIHFDLPFNFVPWSENLCVPPLTHALRRRRWSYAQWLMCHGASLEQRINKDWTVLSMCLTSQQLHRELLEYLFSRTEVGGGYEHLPSSLRSSDGFEVFRLISTSHRLRNQEYDFIEVSKAEDQFQSTLEYHDDYSDCDDDDFEEDDLNVFPKGLRDQYKVEHRNCKAYNRRLPVILHRSESCAFSLNTWSLMDKDKLKRRHERAIGRPEMRHFLESADSDGFETKNLSRVGQCWKYLLYLYPEVENTRPIEVAYLRLSVPVLIPQLATTTKYLPEIRWLYLSLPYPSKPPSLFEQCLRMGQHSQLLYSLTVQRFLHRSELRPDSTSDAFPLQTWSDWLFGSPLDRITYRSLRHCILKTKYGYWRSIHDPGHSTILLVFASTSLWLAGTCLFSRTVVRLFRALDGSILYIFIFAPGVMLGALALFIVFTMCLYGTLDDLFTRILNRRNKRELQLQGHNFELITWMLGLVGTLVALISFGLASDMYEYDK